MTPEQNSWLKQKQIAEYLLSQSTRDGTLRSSPVTKTFEDGIRVGVEAAYSEIMAAPVAPSPVAPAHKATEAMEREIAALRERVKELESFLSPFRDLKGDL